MLGACKDEDASNDGGGSLDAGVPTSDAGAPADGAPSPDGAPNPVDPPPRSAWRPNYPGKAIGCETTEANLALRECVDHVFPHDLEIDPFTVCDPEDIVHLAGCPTPLSTASGPIVAACQDHVEITDPTNFPEFINVLTYQNFLVERGREAQPGDPESPVQLCERFVREFHGTLCPLDADFTDVALDSVDCNAAATAP